MQKDIEQAETEDIQKNNKLAQNLKDEGNILFQDNNYLKALQKYSEGLKYAPQNDVIMSNRAQCYLQLNDYFFAYLDAKKSIEINNNNFKHHHRYIQALRGLNLFYEAQQELNNIPEQIAQNKKEIQEELTKLVQKQIDFNSNSNQLLKMYKKEDQKSDILIRDFIGPVEIRNAFEKGRGVFATRDIEQGELLIVQKAIAFYDQNSQTDNQLKDKYLKTQRKVGKHYLRASSNVLIEKIFNQVQQSSLNRLRIQYLDGAFEQNNNQQEQNNQDQNKYCPSIQLYQHNPLEYLLKELQNNHELFEQKITEEQIAQVVDKNILKSEPNHLVACSTQGFNTQNYTSEGLWTLVSFINHSCVPNASRGFAKDFCVVKAVKNIKKDEEISIIYVPDDLQGDKKIEMIQKSWGFTCCCVACKFQMENKLYIEKTEQIVNQIIEFKSQQSENLQIEFDSKAIQAIQEQFFQLISKLKENLIYIPGVMSIIFHILTYFIKNEKFVEANHFLNQIDNVYRFDLDSVQSSAFIVFLVIKLQVIANLKNEQKQMLDALSELNVTLDVFYGCGQYFIGKHLKVPESVLKLI